MDKEKIVVILLLVTILLSIGSLVVTYSLNFGGVKEINIREAATTQTGNEVEGVRAQGPELG